MLVIVNKLPHTEPLLVPSKGFEQERVPSKDSGGLDTPFSGYDASIKDIPSHILIPVGFEVARTSPWAVEKWSSLDLKT